MNLSMGEQESPSKDNNATTNSDAETLEQGDIYLFYGPKKMHKAKLMSNSTGI
jgi:hypothetical protein